MDVTGKMQMPGPDGKMKDMTFKGMGIEDYDNVKKKFVGTWVDNMGTGIMMSEGRYDVATKTSRVAGPVVVTSRVVVVVVTVVGSSAQPTSANVANTNR